MARPPGLAPLPRFRNDALDPARGGGDLCVQACAEDPLVVFHAIRVLGRLAEGVARVRWMQRGFGATTDFRAGGETPRNLQGFKDGTANPSPDDSEFGPDGLGAAGRRARVGCATARSWSSDGSGWIMDRWEAVSVADQELAIGRTKVSGAPLSGGTEHTPVDLQARGPDEALLIPDNSHVHLTNPARNFGARMLRRGYSYDNGWDPTANGGVGLADAGLLFLAYVRDPVGAIRAHAAAVGQRGRAQSVHRARRERGLRHPARGARGRLRRANALRVVGSPILRTEPARFLAVPTIGL